MSARESYCLSEDTCPEPRVHLIENDSIGLEMGEILNFENIYDGRSEVMRATYEEGLNHIARYIESFESRSNEIWLVFRHEGISLSKILYTAEEVVSSAGERNEQVKNVQILHPSKWWYWLKTTEAGQEEMRNLIWQLVCDFHHFGYYGHWSSHVFAQF